MKTSLAIENWYVQLASSSRTVGNQAMSYTKESKLKADAKAFDGEEMGGKTVHGRARALPAGHVQLLRAGPAPLRDPGLLQQDRAAPGRGRGGGGGQRHQVRRLRGGQERRRAEEPSRSPPTAPTSRTASGSSSRTRTAIEQTIFLDYLEFDGWRKLVWNNPNYITEVRNREVRKYPLYPNSEPFLKLVGLIFYRDSMQQGGDIVTYVKDIKITYDKALLETQRDINDEAIWGILDRQVRGPQGGRAQAPGQPAGAAHPGKAEDAQGRGRTRASRRNRSFPYEPRRRRGFFALDRDALEHVPGQGGLLRHGQEIEVQRQQLLPESTTLPGGANCLRPRVNWMPGICRPGFSAPGSGGLSSSTATPPTLMSTILPEIRLVCPGQLEVQAQQLVRIGLDADVPAPVVRDLAALQHRAQLGVGFLLLVGLQQVAGHPVLHHPHDQLPAGLHGLDDRPSGRRGFRIRAGRAAGPRPGPPWCPGPRWRR